MSAEALKLKSWTSMSKLSYSFKSRCKASAASNTVSAESNSSQTSISMIVEKLVQPDLDSLIPLLDIRLISLRISF